MTTLVQRQKDNKPAVLAGFIFVHTSAWVFATAPHRSVGEPQLSLTMMRGYEPCTRFARSSGQHAKRNVAMICSKSSSFITPRLARAQGSHAKRPPIR